MARAGGAARYPQNMYRALKRMFSGARICMAGDSHVGWQEDPLLCCAPVRNFLEVLRGPR